MEILKEERVARDMHTEIKGRTADEKIKEMIKKTNGRNVRSHVEEWSVRKELPGSSNSQNVHEFQKFS